MDLIHEVDNKPWISKNIINLRELISKRQIDSIDNEDSVLSDELDRFESKGETEVKPYFFFNSTDERSLIEEPKCRLKTYQLQLEHAKKMISDRGYKINYLMSLHSTRKEILMRHLASVNRPLKTVEENSCTPTNQIVAQVVVQIWPQPNKTTKLKFEKEILFTSKQKLTELRDQFKCQRDYGVPMDLSEDPKQAERIFRGELFKSGFFLINDTFYNDLRDQSNIDLSSDIIEWASKEVMVRAEDGSNKRAKKGLGPFKKKRMEDCTFEDIDFRLGCPYLYLHQGNCEHLFTIADIRYVRDDLEFRQTKFPFITASSIGHKADNLRCYICKNRPPHWYTRNNNRLPVDPCFFCENCFYSFNYDKNSKKIGNFQAYLYTSTHGIPDGVVM